MTSVLVGALTDFPENAGTCIDADGVALAVFRSEEDVFAIANRCSHAEASLCEGEVFDGEVECPLHGAAFDIATGRALTLPATKPVATFLTEVMDGNVFVSIPDSEESR
jgi:3-phenylpropionate/trans-cinnamate dioxygenase ferredoxin subunit